MSNIVVDKKTYQGLLKKQASIEAEVSILREVVLELSKNEIKPDVVKRLEKQSHILDKNGGKRLSGLREFKFYTKNI